MHKILLLSSSVLLLFWGIAHLIPINSVVKKFGDISEDNKRILTMEWITEGLALLFIAVVIATLTLLDDRSMISTTIYVQCIVMLNVLSVVSLFTGFKVKFLPYKLCPLIFTGSSILILLGLLM